MRSCNGTFFTSDASPPPLPGLVFAFGLLQAPFCSNVSGFWPTGGCRSSRICKLLDAILLPVKAGTGTDAIFTYGVHSPVNDERRSITFFPFPPRRMKID